MDDDDDDEGENWKPSFTKIGGGGKLKALFY